MKKRKDIIKNNESKSNKTNRNELEFITIKIEREELEAFRNWYKTKVIDTGISQKIEKGIVKGIQIEKDIIEIAGSVATIVLLFYPVAGKFAKICTVMATPLLSKIIDLQCEIGKQILIRGKRTIELKFLGLDGSCKEVKIEGRTLIQGFKNATGILKDVKGKQKVK